MVTGTPWPVTPQAPPACQQPVKSWHDLILCPEQGTHQSHNAAMALPSAGAAGHCSAPWPGARPPGHSAAESGQPGHPGQPPAPGEQAAEMSWLLVSHGMQPGHARPRGTAQPHQTCCFFIPTFLRAMLRWHSARLCRSCWPRASRSSSRWLSRSSC